MISKNQIKFIRSLEQKKNRRREGLFVAEGPKVVGDLLRAGFVPHSIYSTADLPSLSALPTSLSVQTVTDDELQRISFLQHPQQVLAVFRLPADASTQQLPPSSLSLALDGIQDPGNLGTIIRIADWFGISDIYCSPDTADAYNPKVVQATMGSLAHVHITYCNLVTLLTNAPCPVYGTLLDGDDIYQQPLTPNGIIVMGNEGNGISPAVRPLITHRLLIPNFNVASETAESLNVAIATAITCSEFRRRF
ncbi:MAG: RNA methyltransferase [Prevotella sp.]|nr:RNA methyltransferase [Prevotella sp.]